MRVQGDVFKAGISTLADRWHKTSIAKPFELADGATWLRSTGETDRYPQPGYVGSLFRHGGMLLLAMNPGGKGENDTEHDRSYFTALRALRESTDHVAAFSEWNRTFAQVAVTWKYYSNLISPILVRLGMELERISYLN